MNHVDWCRDLYCGGCEEDMEIDCARCGHMTQEPGAKVYINDQELFLCHGCEEYHRCYEEYLAETPPLSDAFLRGHVMRYIDGSFTEDLLELTLPTGGDRTNSSTPTGSEYLAELTAHVRNARQ